jgi:hypothetical protein
LLDQITAPLASFIGDGAYDQTGIYDTIAKREPDAEVIVPPRSTGVPSDTAESAPNQRDRHLQSMAEHGRMGWQRRSGYTPSLGGGRHQPAETGDWKRLTLADGTPPRHRGPHCSSGLEPDA